MKRHLVSLAGATFVALLAVTAMASLASAAAPDDRGSEHARKLALQGVIGDVQVMDAGTLLTLDKGRADDNPADDVLILVTPDTKVQPEGTDPQVGMAAKVLAQPAANDGDPLVGLLVVLQPPRGDDHPGKGEDHRALRVCGEITALPDDPHSGPWTLHVEGVDDYVFEVNADTQFDPEDATPAVGDSACAALQTTDAGLVAKEIKLREQGDDNGHSGMDHGQREVEFRATVVGPLPEDMSGEWTLGVSVPGHPNVTSVQVSADTKIVGDLADGARLEIHARRTLDAAGNEVLVATHIVVLPEPGSGRDKPAQKVRVEGQVTTVSDDGMTWTVQTEHGDTVDLTLNADTKIVGLAAGDDPVGREVVGTAAPQSDGSLLALVLRVHRD